MTLVQDILSNLVGELLFAIASVVLGYFMLRYRSAAESTKGKPILSPDKRKVAFEHKGEIWVDGNNLTHHTANDNQVLWSPEGKYFAFVSERDYNPEVYIAVIATRKLIRVTDLPGIDQPVGWNEHGDLMISTQANGIVMIRKEDIEERANG